MTGSVDAIKVLRSHIKVHNNNKTTTTTASHNAFTSPVIAAAPAPVRMHTEGTLLAPATHAQVVTRHNSCGNTGVLRSRTRCLSVLRSCVP